MTGCVSFQELYILSRSGNLALTDQIRSIIQDMGADAVRHCIRVSLNLVREAMSSQSKSSLKFLNMDPTEPRHQHMPKGRYRVVCHSKVKGIGSSNQSLSDL